jgi:hypothetical protein
MFAMRFASSAKAIRAQMGKASSEVNPPQVQARRLRNLKAHRYKTTVSGHRASRGQLRDASSDKNRIVMRRRGVQKAG